MEHQHHQNDDEVELIHHNHSDILSSGSDISSVGSGSRTFDSIKIRSALETIKSSQRDQTPPLTPREHKQLLLDSQHIGISTDSLAIDIHPNSPTVSLTSPIKISAFSNIHIPTDNENILNEYTNSHAMKIMNQDFMSFQKQQSEQTIHDFDIIENLGIRSNSPILMSNNNSFHGGSDRENSDHENSSQLNARHVIYDSEINQISSLDHLLEKNAAVKKYKKLTYEDVAKTLSHYYDDYNKYSNEMDILITYIRGQKNLFQQSSIVTSNKLYTLLILALCITAFVSIVTPFIEQYKWNVILVTSCNACATLIISVTRYMKLEFTGNAYSFLANNYEKFEHSLEITNNKLVFMENEHEQSKMVLEKIKELEFKIGEIKDIFQVLIPPEVKTIFPVISHVNIFSFIKKMESHKRNLIIKYRDIKNEMNYNLHKLHQQTKHLDINSDDAALIKEKNRILYLNEIKDKIKSELLNYKEAYNQIDYLFTKEMQYAEQHVNIIYFLPVHEYFYGKAKYLDIDKYSNPVIKDYLRLILNDG